MRLLPAFLAMWLYLWLSNSHVSGYTLLVLIIGIGCIGWQAGHMIAEAERTDRELELTDENIYRSEID